MPLNLFIYKILDNKSQMDIQVLDKAIIPDKPIKPKMMLNVAISAILGLFISICLVFFWSPLKRKNGLMDRIKVIFR